MALVLTVTIPGAKYEIHILKPGERFERFGGSRHALFAGKDGAMIVREHLLARNKIRRPKPPKIWLARSDLNRQYFRYASDQISDTEYEPGNRGVWQSIAKWINDTTGEIKAEE